MWVYQTDQVYNKFTPVRVFLYHGNYQLNNIIKREEIPFKIEERKGCVGIINLELSITFTKEIIKNFMKHT